MNTSPPIPAGTKLALLQRHSHSDEAVRPLDELVPGLLLEYRDKIGDVFAAADEGMHAAIPVEVGDVGLVWPHMEKLLRGGYQIVLTIDHSVDNRLGTKPGVEPDQVTEIYSYPPALRQCSLFVAASGAKVIDTVHNTAHAAEIVGALPDGSRAAAISTRSALKANGLTVSETSVNNRDPADNITQFMVVRKAEGTIEPDPNCEYHAAVMTVRDYPGALRDLTAIFDHAGIDLISVHSDKERGGNTRNFFIEMRRQESPEKFAVALRKLDAQYGVIEQMQWLGSWDTVIGKNGNGGNVEEPGTHAPLVEGTLSETHRYQELTLIPYNVRGVLHDLLTVISGSGVDLKSFESINLGHKRYAFKMILDLQSTSRYQLQTLVADLANADRYLSSLTYGTSFDNEPTDLYDTHT